MTNTLNTPIEAMELAYPLAARRYEIRRGSGGHGRHRGGDGVIREIETLVPAVVTIVTERRSRQPWGLAGGQPGRSGVNRGTIGGDERGLPGKAALELAAGDVIRIETPRRRWLGRAGRNGRGALEQTETSPWRRRLHNFLRSKLHRKRLLVQRPGLAEVAFDQADV